MKMTNKKLYKATTIASALVLLASVILTAPMTTANAQPQQGTGIMPTLAPQLPQPPLGFDPLTATDQELAEYGFPARPTDATGLAIWQKAMSHAKIYVKPEQYPTTTVYGLVRTSQSINWAGYIVNSSDNPNNGYTPSYTRTIGEWYQVPSTNTGMLAFWTGIGGGPGSSYIVQAGATSNLPTSPYYEFWVEDYPYGAIKEAQPPVNSGDQVYVDVTYGGSTSTAFLLDETTVTYTTVTFNTPDYDGKSADYIYEDPNTQVYGQWSGANPFSSCYLYWTDQSNNSGAGYFDSYGYQKIIMNDGAYDRGWPSDNPSGGSFDMYSY